MPLSLSACVINFYCLFILTWRLPSGRLKAVAPQACGTAIIPELHFPSLLRSACAVASVRQRQYNRVRSADLLRSGSQARGGEQDWIRLQAAGCTPDSGPSSPWACSADTVPLGGPRTVETARSSYHRFAQLLTQGHPKENMALAQKLRPVLKELPARSCQLSRRSAQANTVPLPKGDPSICCPGPRRSCPNPSFSFLFTPFLVEHILRSSLDRTLRMESS